MAKEWNGTQSDKYTYDRNMKPEYPDCDRPDQQQFSDNESASTFGADNYIPATFDRNNQVIPERRAFDHDSGAVGDQGRFGNRMFADADQAGTADSMSGYNVIEYGSGAAFDRSQSVTVDNSRADRGKES